MTANKSSKVIHRQFGRQQGVVDLCDCCCCVDEADEDGERGAVCLSYTHSSIITHAGMLE